MLKVFDYNWGDLIAAVAGAVLGWITRHLQGDK